MKKKLFLHIGTYKTGSTSIQHFLLDHADFLRRQGIAFYRGQFEASNHIELHLAALRYERDSFAKQTICKRLHFDAAFTQQVAGRVHRFLRSCPEPNVLFTSEGLSLLRHDDEIERLLRVLDNSSAETTVIVYLRDKETFLRSYISQLHKVKGRKPATDYWSGLYVEPDTWLTDYDTLIAKYEKGFGAGNVVVIDYDAEMKTTGNVIPSFLGVLGIDAAHEFDLSAYFRNATKDSATHHRSHGWRQRAKLAWDKWIHRRAA